ncbi:hypothetical protein PCAR4_500008 [Paraburkholderia caribensis]|nr:hypothetical protein PCAR4_500008 [Paraburkholderia caribensis]
MRSPDFGFAGDAALLNQVVLVSTAVTVRKIKEGFCCGAAWGSRLSTRKSLCDKAYGELRGRAAGERDWGKSGVSIPVD